MLVLVMVGASLIAGASAGGAAQTEREEVVAAVAHDFYPEYMVDADGRPGGYAIDMMNAVAKRAGLSVTYRMFQAWSDLIAALERGDADVVPVVSVTQAREGRMLFTRPALVSPCSLFVRQDSDGVHGWTDLAGRRVAMIEDGFSAEILSERYPSARLVPYPRLQDALFGLLSGEVDALVSLQSSVWKVGERARLADRIKVVGDPLTKVKRAIAVRQDLPGLRDRLDAAVADFLDSSEYRKLYSEWYAAPPPFWNPGGIGWFTGASPALLLLGMLFWQSLSLRAESRRNAESAPGKLPGERAVIEFPNRVMSRGCGLVAFALGLAVLLGWAFDVTGLKSVLPGLFAMQPSAATAIALAGGALLAATAAGRIAVVVSTALAGTVVIIGLQTLLQYVTGLDLGTDWWLFPEAVSNQPGHLHPGRVAEISSIAFALLGTMLLIARIERAWARAVFTTIGTVGLLLMAAPLLGYLIDAGTLQPVAFFTPVAVHTALGLVVLFLGALALRRDTGWMALLSGDRPGATSARMLLPVVVIGPVLLALLFEAGKNAAIYGPEFQLALTMLATIALLATSLLWSAARLDRLHRARLAGVDALRKANAERRRLRGALDLATAIVQDKDGTICYWSAGCESLYGYTAAEAMGRVSHELLETEFSVPFPEIKAALTRDGEWRGELRHRRKDGRKVWVSTRLVHNGTGHPSPLVLENSTDVTPLRQSREALEEIEIRLRTVLDACPDEIMLLSTDGTVLTINKSAERRLTKRTGERNPVGDHLDRLLPQDEVEQRMAAIRQVASTATVVHREIQIGSRWFECWYFPVILLDRSVAEVALYTRDITEQRKSQAELRMLFQVIQQSSTSIIITDQDGRIEYVNPKFTDVTGYTMAEAIGRNPRMLKSGNTPPEHYADLWNTISAGGVWRGELLNKKKSGELFWELASIAPVKNGEEVTKFVAVKEDITKRKQIEDQLRHSQKMEVLGQLTGGIAHDFNNILAIIMSNLEFLGERVSGNGEVQECLRDALWSVTRGGELTHRLLAFARRQTLKPAVIELNDVVRGMGELLRRTLGATIRIEEMLAPDLWKALADRGELERALVNLAVNSRDAMPNGGTLTLATRNACLDEDYASLHEEVTPGEYPLLEVIDTGTGMPPEIAQRVFEPFFTTKEVGKGSGLGLSMVYGFIRQSGGHVSIYSRVGQGTCVMLYLPRAGSNSPRPAAASPEVSTGGLANNTGGLANNVVLVVEDEARLRKAAIKMLERLGLRTMQAETAKDALGFLADTHVDVLFTDIELPGGMNGMELVDAARKLDPNIKVLFTTGYAREAVERDRWLQEKVPWLLKPYSQTDLARELKALLAPAPH